MTVFVYVYMIRKDWNTMWWFELKFTEKEIPRKGKQRSQYGKNWTSVRNKNFTITFLLYINTQGVRNKTDMKRSYICPHRYYRASLMTEEIYWPQGFLFYKFYHLLIAHQSAIIFLWVSRIFFFFLHIVKSNLLSLMCVRWRSLTSLVFQKRPIAPNKLLLGWV